METAKTKPVLTEATLENLRDLWEAERGCRVVAQVRKITVPDAQVSATATLLSVPGQWIKELGLERTGSRWVASSAGRIAAALYGPVRLTIQGRSCTMEVFEVPDGVPVLIGQIPLTHLDLVVDLRSRSLIGNPEHGGEHMYEMY